jgi:hypothetical protein
VAPARINFSIAAWVFVAGPKVATIFVLLGMCCSCLLI